MLIQCYGGNCLCSLSPTNPRPRFLIVISMVVQVMEQSDVLYGQPGEGQVKRMQTAVARIQSLSTWQQRLEVLGVKPEGEMDLDVFLTQVLRGAWHRSLAKGYHKEASS